MNFPIDIAKVRGIPLNCHPGAYGCQRKFDIHTGIDLYGSKGDSVFAMEDGLVIDYRIFTGPEIGMWWWLTTYALLVKHKDCYRVYAEIESSLRKGDIVEEGSKIGSIIPVLPDNKFRTDIGGHSTSMLHLERYDLSYDVNSDWCAWESLSTKPIYLTDPTTDLINILSNNHLVNMKKLLLFR